MQDFLKQLIFYYYILVFIIYVILVIYKVNKGEEEEEEKITFYIILTYLLLGHIAGVTFSLLNQKFLFLLILPVAYEKENYMTPLFIVSDIFSLIAGIMSLVSIFWRSVRDEYLSYLYIFIGFISSILCFYKNKGFIGL